jgi:RNA polymerase sigma-70 factor (ECF subfamily)
LFLLFVFATEQERDKFEYIFRKYNRLMLHKAYGILQDYHLAEDATSEAFIRIHKNMHKIDDPTDKKSIAFIITIVKNVSLTMLKKERSYNTEEYDEELQDDFNLEESTISQLSSEFIYQTVDKLGEEMKAVFLLRYVSELSHKEIARILGISENNVTVRLHRAKKKLAELLSEAKGGHVSA